MTGVRFEHERYKVAKEPVQTIKQKCAECLKGRNLIKTVVVLACTSVVVQQITVCITKLIDVPITTYTHFDFNKTIQYPSVTFCREPPYKYEQLLKYNLVAHPRFTSSWIRFNFSASTLDDLWQDVTYDPHEFFAQYGLNGSPDNVEIRSTIGFVNGRCHTLVPKILISQASKSSGYSVTLQHNAQDVATSTSVYPPGYHVYVHYTKEPYTEVQVYNGGLVDYFYVNIGETLDVKLTAEIYVKISDEEDPCTHDTNYSANNCTSEEVWDLVGAAAGCSGPWMTTSQLPRCDNYTAMRTLISSYIQLYDGHSTSSCPRFCHAYLYSAFVTERQKLYTWDSVERLWSLRAGDAELQSQLYMHFNSMMVPVYEERYNYDWNLFISDLGGSVGFLLGLSVIGLMTIVGKMWYNLVSPFFKSSKTKNAPSITSSSTTAQIEELYKEQLNDQKACKNKGLCQKCYEWQIKSFKDFGF